MITDKEYKKAQLDIEKANKIINEYKSQQNFTLVDDYIKKYSYGFGMQHEAMKVMNSWVKFTNQPAYCYEKSNGRFIVTLQAIENVNPTLVLSPEPLNL